MENRYDKYKDSGVAWIGEIPEHWNIVQLKRCSEFINGYAFNSNYFNKNTGIPVIRIGDICNEKISFENIVYVQEDKDLDKFIVQKNDILIAMSGATVGKIGIYEDENIAYINQRVGIIRAHQYDFIKRMFFTKGFTDYISLSSAGSAQPNISSDEILNFYIPFPLKKEQQTIAAYLDQKCGEIDELITLQEKMITKLQSYKQSVITEAVTKGLDKNVPLKDSGIEWIGEIPEHWKVAKIKSFYNVILGKMVERNNDSNTGDENYLCAANIKWNGVDTEINKKMYFSDIEKEKYLLQYNDVLIMEGGMAGTACLYKNEFSPCYVQNSVNVCRAKKDFNNKFLYYWMYVPYYNGYIDAICNKATIRHYTKEKVQNTPILISSLVEQQSIATYLDQKCSEIDELISIKQQKIEKLKEYKKSLIFECVTGKRKVS